MHKLFKGKMMLLLVLTLALALGLSAESRRIDLSSSSNQALLRNNSDLGFDVQYSVGELKITEVQTKEGVFDELSIAGWGFTNTVGEPKLPMLRQLIAVPLGATVRHTLNSQSVRELDAAASQLRNRIIPAQEPVSKSADPATLPFVVNAETYGREGFNTREWVQLTELGIMRGVRVFALDFFPVRYDAASNTILVMENFDVHVDFDNPDLIATADMLARTASSEFDQLYGKTFFNWDASTRTVLVRHPTKMVILCPPSYTSNIQSYVDWKTQQGFAVSVVTVGSGGTVANTTTAIKAYMQTLWNSATVEDPAPTYLLIIGDQSGAIAVNTNTGVTDSHVTDLTYVRLSGTDYMPEMYHGRFSVSNTTELANIVNKTVTFEKTQMPDLSYLGKVVMIAGVDSGFGPTHANGAINYGTAEYFNAAHGITSNTYLYPASGSSDAAIIANANEGRGYINYTAHGSETGWYDPSFTVTNVNSMTNADKYGIMVGNCCLTNAFDTGVCFGEAIIRKANGGGVAYIAGINSTYWDEDYYWAVGYKTPINGTAPAYNATKLGAYDAMFHTHGEVYANWATTTGETIYMGNLAVQQSGSSLTNYYWEIYHVMGDPSLMSYLGVPTANAAVYPGQIFIGQAEVEITGAAPYSRVAITMDGVIYGTALTDASGYLNLALTPFTDAGTATLVITAPNKITLIDEIDVIANDGPWISVTATVYDDANNELPDYNESGYLDVTFKNVGSDPASAVTAILTSATEGITITDNSANFASLAPDTATTIDNAYAISIADDFADGSVANFTITMTSGSNTWVKNFNLTINAPELAFGGMTVSDPTGDNDGLFDPGETVTLTIPLNNTGGAASLDGSGTVTCATTGITIINGSSSFPAITAGGYATLSFTASAEASMAEGTLAPFVFQATAGAYEADTTVNVEIGAPLQVIIGSGTSTQTYPIDRYYNYSSHEAIYLSTEIGTAGTIKSIAFHKASGSDVSTIEAVTIYMKNTTASTLATGTYSTTGYTQVYSGNWPNTATSGWMEVNLDTLFPYNGTNLSILTIKGNQAYISSNYPYWSYTTSSTTRARQARSDTSQPTSLTASNNQPNLMLRLFPMSAELNPAQNLFAEAGNGLVELSWDAPYFGIPSGYQIFRDGSLLTTVTGLTYTDSAVVNETTYSYYVVAIYNGEAADPSNTVQATPTSNLPVEATLGTGSFSSGVATPCPVNINFQSLHGQSVYTAAELNAAGVFGPVQIMKIGFNVTGIPTLSMPNYVIRLGHTTAINGASWIPAANLTQVWSSTSYRPTETGWNLLTLATPFTWNGTDNIVVDTAFGLIGSTHASGQTQYTSITTGYRTAVSNAADMSNVFSGGTSVSYRPNLRIAYMSEALAAPAVTIATSETAGVTISWPAVPNAGQYQILRALEPYGTYEHLAYTEDLSYNDTEANDMAFYKVRALSEPPAKQTTSKK